MLALNSFFEEFDFDDDDEDRPARRRRAPFARRGTREVDDDDFEDRRSYGGGGGLELRRIGLLALVLLAIAAIGYYLITSCQRSKEEQAFKDFATKANTISSLSAANGAALSKLIVSKDGQSAGDIPAAIQALAEKQKSIVADAQKLSGPGELANARTYLVNAEQLRLNALTGMASEVRTAFAEADKSKDKEVSDEAAQNVAILLSRVVAGDVLYKDLFEGPGNQVLKDKSIDAKIASSLWVQPELLRFMNTSDMRQRLTQLNGGGGSSTPDPNAKVGTSIDKAVIKGVSADGVELDPQAAQNEVKLTGDSTDTLVVSITNSGDISLTEVKVQVKIDNGEVQEKVIPVMDPGDKQDVSFPLGSDISIGGTFTISVDVPPVDNESNVDNNTISYTILPKFS